ncbi:MAG: glycoside hydrolase family 1 protein [Spirochaetales bacterium]|nr:glycoside hydrolase family 1 protein [Spirochaetales bacterium]
MSTEKKAHPSRPRKGVPGEPWGLEFPEGFLWAAGEDAYQHEGGNDHADWYDWEHSDPRPFSDGSVSGICADFWNRYESDFTLAERDGHNAHRIGIEWSRVEPEQGIYDDRAFARYGDMLRSLRDKGFTVFVNLWHFTLPAWAARKGGWLNDEVFTRWERYVAACTRRFGPYVDYWSTMIDAQIYVLRGWFVGDIPPLKNDKEEGIRVFSRILDAHAAAYRIIKGEPSAWRTGKVAPRVGMIYFFALYQPRRTFLDRFVCTQLDRFFNRNMPDALMTGRLEIRMAGGPNLRLRRQSWEGTLDWLGVNYYYRQIVSFSPKTLGLVRMDHGSGPVKSDMGWEIYPEGLYTLCAELSTRYPGLPLMITESGMADAEDSRRPRMIVDHAAQVHRLISDGYPVLGFTYWSLTDNLEWTEGFGPKFGLYRVDRETMERFETRSARLFRFMATRNRTPTLAEFESLG